MPFLIIFVVIPLIEIGLFIQVGGQIGVASTLLLCFLTAMFGAFILRHQGLTILTAARQSMESNALPLAEIFDGICLAVAGICLMTPGFFTDAIGFTLLVPRFRVWLRKILISHFGLQAPGQPAGEARPVHVIEGEYSVIDETDEP